MPFLIDRKNRIVRLWEINDEKAQKSGLRHAIFTPGGDKYVGEWKDNLKHGKGRMEYVNCTMYEGDFEEDMWHGYGTLSVQACDGTWILNYRGDWCKGQRHGQGSRFYADGGYYEGYWEENMRCGSGRMWWPSGAFYIGQWHCDMRHGLGMMVYANGGRFEGTWEYGKKNGEGRFLHLGTGQEQIGMWVNGIARTTTMRYLQFRQSGLNPSSYPIPKEELADPERVICRMKNYLYERNIVLDPEVGDVMICKDSTQTQTMSVDKVDAQRPDVECISRRPRRKY